MSRTITPKLVVHATAAINAITLLTSIALLIVSAVRARTSLFCFRADLFSSVLDNATRTTCLLQHFLDDLCQYVSDIPDCRTL